MPAGTVKILERVAFFLKKLPDSPGSYTRAARGDCPNHRDNRLCFPALRAGKHEKIFVTDAPGDAGGPMAPGLKEVSPLLNCVNDKKK